MLLRMRRKPCSDICMTLASVCFISVGARWLRFYRTERIQNSESVWRTLSHLRMKYQAIRKWSNFSKVLIRRIFPGTSLTLNELLELFSMNNLPFPNRDSLISCFYSTLQRIQNRGMSPFFWDLLVLSLSYFNFPPLIFMLISNNQSTHSLKC